MTTKLAEDWYHCPGCGFNATSKGFYKNKASAHGLAEYCKACCKVKARKYRGGPQSPSQEEFMTRRSALRGI